jgi:FkbM family methyltransferase
MTPEATSEPIPVRPPSGRRRLGKYLLFLSRGLGPTAAGWLARHDAPVGQDYRGIPLPALDGAFRADPSWADVEARDGEIRSRALGLTFGHARDLVTHGYGSWLALSHLGWRFARNPTPGGLQARHAALTLNLATTEDCEMVREIHLMPRCYDLRLAGSWDVVDIGGNVGMAALFFAAQPWCARVFSYEPFGMTAAAFRENVALNPDLMGKIALQEVGLGESEADLEVDYDPQLKGSMSVAGLGAWRGPSATATGKVSIKIERASTALAGILSGPRPVLAKIDCEGSEYGILRDLSASDLLRRFSALIIEWHGAGPEELVALLLGHGFAVQVTPLAEDQRTLGLLHATRLPPAAGVR